MFNRIGGSVIVVLGLVLSATGNRVLAQADNFKDLSAEWWQWALSIPEPDNPLVDSTGEKCAVGEHGNVWFLAGAFFGGVAERTCSVPEGKEIYFPVINSVNFDAPNVCGQGAESIPVEELRATSAAFIGGATDLSVSLDETPIRSLRRTQTKVFQLALPPQNLFDGVCAAFGGLPAGIYSPAVDDGVYVKLDHLPLGDHDLHFLAANPAAGFALDVKYHLTVVASSK
jgi:hypothetical protein